MSSTDPAPGELRTDAQHTADEQTAAEQHRTATSFDPYGPEPDEIAPVDWQADPSHWLPGRALPIVAGIVLLITIVTVVVCLLIWLTPPMEPLQIPVVGKA